MIQHLHKRFWHILGERPCRFLFIKYVTHGSDVTTALSLEKAKGSPNIWIPSGDRGWPAVQMFADMRTSHGLLASVAGQLLPLHHTDILLRLGKAAKRRAWLSFSVCVRMWLHMAALVCLFVCSRVIILTLKITPTEELQKINLTLKSHKSMSPLHICCILMWNMWTLSVKTHIILISGWRIYCVK